MAELKPCPFCGGEAIMETFETVRERKPRFRVKCSECWCETNWDNFSQEEAAEAWNRMADVAFMTNADAFKFVFGIYATELWAMEEKQFLDWLNAPCDRERPTDADVPDRKVGKWIPVTERLPDAPIERNGYVGDWRESQMLVFVQSKHGYYSFEQENDGILSGRFVVDDDGRQYFAPTDSYSSFEVEDVFAWMPLPEPPKEAE